MSREITRTWRQKVVFNGLSQVILLEATLVAPDEGLDVAWRGNVYSARVSSPAQSIPLSAVGAAVTIDAVLPDNLRVTGKVTLQTWGGQWILWADGLSYGFPGQAPQVVGGSLLALGDASDLVLASPSGAPPSSTAPGDASEVGDASAPVLLPSVGPSPGPEPEDESILAPTRDQLDLFPFVWVHPPSRRERVGLVLRFARLADPGALALYTQLAAISGASAPSAKREAAAQFRTGGQFVGSVASLSPPVGGFPALRWKLRAIEGKLALDALVPAVEALLGGTLDAFFASDAWKAARPGVWQSLFVLALAGAPADAALADALVDVLRVAHFLELVQAGNPALVERRGRFDALDAVVVLPDAVATGTLAPPAPAAPPAPPSGAEGSYEVLGVGSVEMARQSLAGYLPGEVAEIVNVLPRERQERVERTASVTAESTAESEQRDVDDDHASTGTASSELVDAVQEEMAADGSTRDMTGVTPSYDNLNVLLTGKGSGGASRATWSDVERSCLARGLTERAARRVGERVARQRGRVRRELWERRDTSVVDNAASGERLVGIYRWLDRVVQVRVETLGRRCVVAFSLDRPAQRWLDRVARRPPVPLQEPARLPAFDVKDGQGYTLIDASSYQSFGAFYGICDLEPPPPATRTVAVALDRVTPGDLRTLCVPEGYAASAGTVTLALGDARYGLGCTVGGELFTIAPVAPAALSAVPVAPASPAVTPPGVSPSAVSASPLQKIAGATGSIPISVASTAPAFQVTVEVSCALAPAASGAVQPALVAWQMRIYDRLLRAWEARARASSEARKVGIDRATKATGARARSSAGPWRRAACGCSAPSAARRRPPRRWRAGCCG